VVLTSQPSNGGKHKIGGSRFRQDTTSKITRAKRARGMAQAVECLPSKHKDLSSSPRTLGRRKEGRKGGKEGEERKGKKGKEEGRMRGRKEE
jgi:hypothetical protein